MLCFVCVYCKSRALFISAAAACGSYFVVVFCRTFSNVASPSNVVKFNPRSSLAVLEVLIAPLLNPKSVRVLSVTLKAAKATFSGGSWGPSSSEGAGGGITFAG